jgi:hypothetical protein
VVAARCSSSVAAATEVIATARCVAGVPPEHGPCAPAGDATSRAKKVDSIIAIAIVRIDDAEPRAA